MKSRFLILFSFLSLLWVVLIARAAYLQIMPNQRLAEVKKKQFEKLLTTKSRRGAIYDREGNGLALSVPAHSLFADPFIIKSPSQTARHLAKILKLDRAKIYKKIKNKNRRFVWIKRQISEAKVNKIKELKIRGLGFFEEPKRIYPNSKRASQVIGMVGREGNGLEGIELQYDRVLKGREKRTIFQRDARGRVLLLDTENLLQDPEGKDVTLTIDSDLQIKLENELMEALQNFEAESAVGLVLDAKTSEILAMANLPTYDPNSPSHYDYSSKKNRSITDAFEPGSTLKPFTVLAGLESGQFKANSLVNCEGKPFRIGRRLIREAAKDHYHKSLSVSEIISHSSNIGTSKIALKIGRSSLLSVLNRFGFGQKTGIEFPGETKGLINEGSWAKHLLANVSFGHGISVSPLQMATAYAAIANKGQWKRPTLIKSIEGETLKPRTAKQIIEPSLAKTMVLMLTQATASGSTGANARVKGFPVAGKTGTAQKVDFQRGGYKKGAYISSFAGFIPAHDPKFVIYIAVDSPQKAIYGSQVAAPVFSKVAGYAMRKSGEAPILISQTNVVNKDNFKIKINQLRPQKKGAKLNKTKNILVPDLVGLSLRQVMAEARLKKFKFHPVGQGVVVKTHPEMGEEFLVKGNSKVMTIYFE